MKMFKSLALAIILGTMLEISSSAQCLSGTAPNILGPYYATGYSDFINVDSDCTTVHSESDWIIVTSQKLVYHRSGSEEGGFIAVPVFTVGYTVLPNASRPRISSLVVSVGVS